MLGSDPPRTSAEAQRRGPARAQSRIARALDHPLAPLVHAVLTPMWFAPFLILVTVEAPPGVVLAAMCVTLVPWTLSSVGIGWMAWRRVRRWHSLAAVAGWRVAWRANRVGTTLPLAKRMPDGREVFAAYGRGTEGDILLWTRARVGGKHRDVAENILLPADGAELDRLAMRVCEAARLAEETGALPRSRPYRPLNPRRGP